MADDEMLFLYSTGIAVIKPPLKIKSDFGIL